MLTYKIHRGMPLEYLRAAHRDICTYLMAGRQVYAKIDDRSVSIYPETYYYVVDGYAVYPMMNEFISHEVTVYGY